MAKPFKSDFAILDVKQGRAELAKRFGKDRPRRGAGALRVPVVIHGYIDGIWGNDDGTSQEFCVTVTKVVER